MKKLTFEQTITYEFVTCCSCTFPVALPADLLKKKREEGGSFYCPLCGSYQGWERARREEKLNAEIERLKKNLAWEANYGTQQREQREAAERKLSATKGVVTRLKNRAMNGVCPCCNRHFTNLERHMHTKHPGFAAPTKAEEGEQ